VVRFQKQGLSPDCSAEILLSFHCEYCFSHYVTAVFLCITRYKLLFDDWRGYLIAGFSLVAVANLYMSLFGRLREKSRKRRSRLHWQSPCTNVTREVGFLAANLLCLYWHLEREI